MKNLRSGISRCAATKCTNNAKNCDFSFFRFPKDVDRSYKQKIWLIASSREDLLGKLENLHASYRLCAAHFENKMFLNDLHNRLHKKAVPTLFPSLEGSSSKDTKQPPAFNTSTEDKSVSQQMSDDIIQKNVPTAKMSSSLPSSPIPMKEDNAIPNKIESSILLTNTSSNPDTSKFIDAVAQKRSVEKDDKALDK
ncbi:hypothetical protein NQ317_016781 [Molorchus minor]|uniref:THAP-type domain-containing protein n=1 Tax=Molorchus minor TaxID=1323400 RepID=A0ABQ9IYG6_9CUCU|nr:hypothetical protein NQ317_016781 [Molorchus minor]